jgi:hypothetical protein
MVTKRLAAKLVISALTILILIMSARLAHADAPIAGRYRFHAAVNQPTERMSGYLSFDPLGGVSGWANSPRKPTRRTPGGNTCNVLISGVYMPARRGNYKMTMTLIPTTFSCEFKQGIDETLRLNVAPLDQGHELKLATNGRSQPLFSGTAVRQRSRWFTQESSGS